MTVGLNKKRRAVARRGGCVVNGLDTVIAIALHWKIFDSPVKNSYKDAGVVDGG